MADETMGNGPRGRGEAPAIGYARCAVAADGDGLDEQNAANRAWAEENLGQDVAFMGFSDESAGGAVRRNGLEAALDLTSTRSPGVLVVESLAKLSRSSFAVLRIVHDLIDRGWRFVSRADGIDTSSAEWELPMQVSAMAHEYEIDRQRLRARAVGRKKKGA